MFKSHSELLQVTVRANRMYCLQLLSRTLQDLAETLAADTLLLKNLGASFYDFESLLR